MLFPDLRARVDVREWMDDFSVADDRLAGALRDLEWTNRLLGGYAATNAVLDPLLKRAARCRILDVGSGGGEFVAHLVRRGARFGCRAEVVGVDANAETVEFARRTLDRALPPTLRERATVRVGDALDLDAGDDAFDVAHASLFLHHFFGDALVRCVREMDRVSRAGIVVNDLHRHPLAYTAIRLLTGVLPVSAMYRHDAPASVRRAFQRRELHALAHAAALPALRVRWHWAFRWTADTISDVGMQGSE
jgi:SAM-dependent methyltransferase